MLKSYIIGGLHRRNFRRMLQSAGLKYIEDKTLLDSQFAVHADPKTHNQIINYINDCNYKSEFELFDFKIPNDKASDFEGFVKSIVDKVFVKRGWFKTKFEIYCHPTDYHILKVFQNRLTN